jgi:hypothetical protein
MTMQLKAICLCLQRRHHRLLCCSFKILKISRLKILLLLAQLALGSSPGEQRGRPWGAVGSQGDRYIYIYIPSLPPSSPPPPPCPPTHHDVIPPTDHNP